MISLSGRFASAVQWNLAISAVTVAAQLGVTAIVARLLTPDDFGLFAVANVALVIAMHLGGPSLILAIVREPVLDAEVVGSAIWLTGCLSIGLAAMTVLLAPLAGIGSGLHQSETLTGLVRLMSVSVVLSGIAAPAQAMMLRELQFRELGLTQFAGLVLGSGATTIALARNGAGPWSLVWGSIAYSAILAGGCWWQMRARWSLRWHRGHLLRVGRVGLQMTLLRVLDALWTQLPLIAAHARLASFDVGLYQRSQSIVEVGIQSTSARVSSVLFPVLAAKQDQDERLRELIPALTGVYALFLLPAAAFVTVAAPLIVVILLGPQWHAAAAPLAVLMVAFASLFISQPASAQLEARGVFGPRTVAAAFGAITVGIGGFLLAGGFSIIGIATAAALSGVGTSVINFCAICTDLRISPRLISSWLAPAAKVAAVVAAATLACSQSLSARIGSPSLALALELLVAGLAFVAGSRLLIGDRKRKALGDLVSTNAPRNVIWVARLFGFSPVSG